MSLTGKQGVLVLVAAAGAASLGMGVWRARLIKGMARVDANIHEVRGDGAAFGQGKDPSACVTEALRLGPGSCTDGDLPCAAQSGLFLEGCLTEYTLSIDFCADVPPPDPLTDSARLGVQTWQAGQCAAAGYPASLSCGRVLHDGLQRSCHTPPDEPDEAALQAEDF